MEREEVTARRPQLEERGGVPGRRALGDSCLAGPHPVDYMVNVLHRLRGENVSFFPIVCPAKRGEAGQVLSQVGAGELSLDLWMMVLD